MNQWCGDAIFPPPFLDVVQMHLDRALADEELFSDLPVVKSMGHHPQDIGFPGGEEECDLVGASLPSKQF